MIQSFVNVSTSCYWWIWTSIIKLGIELLVQISLELCGLMQHKQSFSNIHPWILILDNRYSEAQKFIEHGITSYGLIDKEPFPTKHWQRSSPLCLLLFLCLLVYMSFCYQTVHIYWYEDEGKWRDSNTIQSELLFSFFRIRQNLIEFRLAHFPRLLQTNS